MKIDNRNLTMIMDLYELTMANGIFAGENKTEKAEVKIFDKATEKHGL